MLFSEALFQREGGLFFKTIILGNACFNKAGIGLSLLAFCAAKVCAKVLKQAVPSLLQNTVPASWRLGNS